MKIDTLINLYKPDFVTRILWLITWVIRNLVLRVPKLDPDLLNQCSTHDSIIKQGSTGISFK